MPAQSLTDCSRLCLHTITTRPWSIEEATDKYVEAGVSGITVWREAIEGRNASTVGDNLRAAGLSIVSLCRGGFFPAADASERQAAIDDNLAAIDEAQALGAPLVVLVCGAVQGQPLEVSRAQIEEGIKCVLPRAEEAGVKLAVEPLHPMYAARRSAINTMRQANELCDRISSPFVGVAVDVYHVWWDPDLESEIQRCAAADRLFAFHVCDWRTPTRKVLDDRALMGEGCIDVRGIRGQMEDSGFDGFNEVEIFSHDYWAMDQDAFLRQIRDAYLQHT